MPRIISRPKQADVCERVLAECDAGVGGEDLEWPEDAVTETALDAAATMTESQVLQIASSSRRAGSSNCNRLQPASATTTDGCTDAWLKSAAVGGTCRRRRYR